MRGRSSNKWWETAETKKKTSRGYSTDLSGKAEDAGEDLADTIREDDILLPHLLTTAAVAMTAVGQSFARSFGEVIDWGWPHE